MEKTDLEKIGVNAIKPIIHNGRWAFERNGRKYDIAPAAIMDMTLNPLVIGADKFITLACKLKDINPETEFLLLFSENYFPNADVTLLLKEPKANGWIYSINELNLNGFVAGQSVWVCPYIIMYYLEPPKTIYLKIEKVLTDARTEK